MEWNESDVSWWEHRTFVFVDEMTGNQKALHQVYAPSKEMCQVVALVVLRMLEEQAAEG